MRAIRSQARHFEPRMQWHLITSEYPPQFGGVSDYSFQLAAGLAAQGDDVQVWCPRCDSDELRSEGVTVHRALGSFSHADLQRVGMELDLYPEPRRLLVQWVPHGYGYRSMNVAFCGWLWNRAVRHRDQVELMIHEPYLQFRWSSLRQSAAASVHRLMTVILLQATRRVWMSIPGWEQRLRRYALGRKVRFQWIPIPSNVQEAEEAGAERLAVIRRQYAANGGALIGHFGTYGSAITGLLESILRGLGRDGRDKGVVLLGRGSREFRQHLIARDPGMSAWIHAAGELPMPEVSHHLAACDLLIQPYPDGVSSRRTSFMAGLAHGKPIVTTIGELSEPMWSRSQAVAAVPVTDLDAFVKRTLWLCSDPGERRRIGSEARKLYQERFDISHTIEAFRQ